MLGVDKLFMVPMVRKWRQEDRKIKIILCYIVNTRPAWARRELCKMS